MHVLGISCYYHDAAAALIRDGALVAAAEEERFTRIKHDTAFPRQAIAFCLAHAGVASREVDYVVYYEKPFRKLHRILLTVLDGFPHTAALFRRAMGQWFLDRLWIRDTIQSTLGIPKDRILFCEHHLSHAASAFYPSPFAESAVLTADGVGEWTTATLGAGSGRHLDVLQETHFPHSLGLLYSTFTAFLGFEVNDGEYKVMGMAPYGTPRYVEEITRLLHVKPDGSLWLDMRYFQFHQSVERTFSRQFERLLGPPRAPSDLFFTADTPLPASVSERPPDYTQRCRENQRYADVAASIQRVTEEALLTMARQLHRLSGLDQLCLAGGVALNSVANTRILRETPFRELFVQPAAGDSGGALGAALYAYHTLLGQDRRVPMEHAYWGAAYPPAAVRAFLDEQGIAYEHVPDETRLVDRVVDALLAGRVVGWFQDRFEWGPRALGNRSILADPRRAEMKDLVNSKIKFREPFRPFAPAVLSERASEYFDLDHPERHLPARFMLYVLPVRDTQRARIPATTHVDGTGRVQLVLADHNPLFHRLVERFGQATGVPVLLNTSFNLRGEPIVASPADAHATFTRSGLDLLVLDRFVITKPT